MEPRDAVKNVALSHSTKQEHSILAAPTSNKISTKSAGLVSLAVMSSRILGLVREQIFAALFGAGWQMDAFIAAFRAPNLLRDPFAEGALS